MKQLRYEIVNVFTDDGRNGNGLAVVTDTDGLRPAQMQAVAQKLGFSETSFVFPPTVAGADYRVRFFTPEKELPFAGHPSIGTLFTLVRAGMVKEKKKYVQQLPRRTVTLTVQDNGAIFMDQGAPIFGKAVSARRAAEIVGLEVADVTGYARVVSTGLPHLLVPLVDYRALKRATVQRTAYDDATRRLGAQCVMPFVVQGDTVHCRMFAPGLGIDEDPATGSGCGPLAAFVAEEGLIRCRANGRARIAVKQGTGRRGSSALYVGVQRRDGKTVRVEVGGYCRAVAMRRTTVG